MGNLENKVLAIASIIICVLMTAMVFLTNRVLDKACACQNVIPIGVFEFDKAIHENSKQMDSIFLNADTTVDGALRELWQRYNNAGHNQKRLPTDRAADTKD